MRVQDTESRPKCALFSARPLVFALLTALLVWGCREDPVPLRFNSATLLHDTLYATDDASYPIDGEVSTLLSDRLMVGEGFGYTFRPVVRFIDPPPDIEYVNAWVQFTLGSSFGENKTPFTVQAHPVIEAWISDTDSIWNDYAAAVDFGTILADFLIDTTLALPDTSDSTSFLTMTFNETGLALINTWADTSDTSNYGFILDFSGAPYIQEFQARDITLDIGPRLIMEYVDSLGATAYDSLLAVVDAFLVEGDYTRLADRNYASTLVPWATVLSFDIDSLRRKYEVPFIVSSANLQLPVDWDNSVVHPDLDPDLEIQILISPVDSTAEIDSLFLAVAVDMNRFDADSAYAEVSTAGLERENLVEFFIQRELLFPGAIEGFYVEPKSPGGHLSILSFFKHNQAALSQRPRLIITSVTTPEDKL